MDLPRVGRFPWKTLSPNGGSELSFAYVRPVPGPYEELPPTVQRQADKQHALFMENPHHPSLRLKAVGPFWSVRVSGSYRALEIRKGDIFHWFWIGTHEQYEMHLKRS